MSDEHTPTMEEVRAHWCGGARMRKGAQFDRAIAAHDRALREQIARKIEARRNEPGQIELADRFGGYHAGQSARIARGEEQTDE